MKTILLLLLTSTMLHASIFKNIQAYKGGVIEFQRGYINIFDSYAVIVTDKSDLNIADTQYLFTTPKKAYVKRIAKILGTTNGTLPADEVFGDLPSGTYLVHVGQIDVNRATTYDDLSNVRAFDWHNETWDLDTPAGVNQKLQNCISFNSFGTNILRVSEIKTSTVTNWSTVETWISQSRVKTIEVQRGEIQTNLELVINWKGQSSTALIESTPSPKTLERTITNEIYSLVVPAVGNRIEVAR